MHLLQRGFGANPVVFLAAFVITSAVIVGAGSLLAQAPAAGAADHFAARDWTQAAAAYEQITRAEPANGMAWLRLGGARQNLKQYEAALAAYDQAVKLGFALQRAHYNRATAYALLGRRDDAFAALEQALAAGFPGVQLLKDDPDLTPLRSDSRFPQMLARADRNARPCAHTPENRQFDFWLGAWEVDSAGQPAGASSVQLLVQDCVIFENWTGTNGYVGKSFNVFNPEKKKWQQFWVDSTGGVTLFEGEVGDGKLVYLGQNVANGTPTLRRMTFFKLGDGHVRQLGEDSTDGGKTWTVQYDLNYVRKK